MKKFELTTECITYFGRKLFRIKALISFSNVRTGDLGGFVESENNLSHEGNAWVYGNAKVYGNAWVYGDARVYGNAEVYGDARVYGNAKVYGNAEVCRNAEVYGNAEVCEDARVCGDARVCRNADYATAKGFGSVFRTTTFFRKESGGIGVKCGCFCGTLEEFRRKVRETYPDDKKGREYLMLADLMEYHFDEGASIKEVEKL